MLYSIEYTTHALKFLQALPRETGEVLFDAIERLVDNPKRKGSVRRGNTPSTFYVRVEARDQRYRVSYEIREQRLVIIVLKVNEARVRRRQ
ncbi:type II toxin-antitoxin system RelE/ParE family toxin [Pendulispora albinea]|uniref:Type II toxin-antitoxin system RelE/ParE family toxin n=1 Tax=Pendulispora albinea TaxID=2741071 RepID=A0ABZ2M337_9BACT